MSEIPENVTLVADGLSLQLRHTTRLWLFAATVAFVALTTSLDGEKAKFVTHEINAAIFYPVCAVVLSLVYPAFCASHQQAQRAARILAELLSNDELGEKKIAGWVTVKDIVHITYLPGLNRVYPLVHDLPPTIRKVFYAVLQLLSSIVYYFFPIIGGLYCLQQANWNLFLSVPVLVLLFGPALIVSFKGVTWTWWAMANQAPGKR